MTVISLPKEFKLSGPYLFCLLSHAILIYYPYPDRKEKINFSNTSLPLFILLCLFILLIVLSFIVLLHCRDKGEGSNIWPAEAFNVVPKNILNKLKPSNIFVSSPVLLARTEFVLQYLDIV